MLRADSIVNLRKFDDLIGFARRFPQYVGRVGQSAFQQRKPSLLAPLRQYPQQRAQHKFIWSLDPEANARARNAYFALVRAGKIKTDDYGYIRSGKLGEGYDAELFIRDDEIFIDVTNSESRAYRYTKGRRQLPGHALTGWKKDAPIITQWVSEFRLELVQELKTVRQALGRS